MIDTLFRLFKDQERVSAPNDALSQMIDLNFKDEDTDMLDESALEGVFAARLDMKEPTDSKK